MSPWQPKASRTAQIHTHPERERGVEEEGGKDVEKEGGREGGMEEGMEGGSKKKEIGIEGRRVYM